jgi:hypothetical protein
MKDTAKTNHWATTATANQPLEHLRNRDCTAFARNVISWAINAMMVVNNYPPAVFKKKSNYQQNKDEVQRQLAELADRA